jgi:hypothetical protein
MLTAVVMKISACLMLVSCLSYYSPLKIEMTCSPETYGLHSVMSQERELFTQGVISEVLPNFLKLNSAWGVKWAWYCLSFVRREGLSRRSLQPHWTSSIQSTFLLPISYRSLLNSICSYIYLSLSSFQIFWLRCCIFEELHCSNSNIRFTESFKRLPLHFSRHINENIIK